MQIIDVGEELFTITLLIGVRFMSESIYDYIVN